MTITDAELDRLRALAKAATLGPWRVTFAKGEHGDLPEAFVETTTDQMVCRFDDCGDDTDNAAFIAAAREAVPALITALCTPRAEKDAAVRLPQEPTREMWAAMGDAYIKVHHDHGQQTCLSHDVVTGVIYDAIRSRATQPAPEPGEKV